MRDEKPVENVKFEKKRGFVQLIITAVVLIFLLFVGLQMGKNAGKAKELSRTGFYMDTYVEIKIAATDSDSQTIDASIRDAFGAFARLHEKYNFHDAESYLSKINGESEIMLEDPEFVKILRKSLDEAEKTGGAFDPTLGSFKDLYAVGKEHPVPPSRDEILKALGDSGYKKVTLHGNLLRKPRNLKIDLGGFLKGYAVDSAVSILEEQGYRNFLVNGGGNVVTRGVNAQGEPWRIGVENPRNPQRVLGVLSPDNRAVATSGDYQRFFIHEGVRYHHVIDPRTGYPAGKAFAATVIAPDALTADIYSTAAFVLGKEDGIRFLERVGCEGIITDESGSAKTFGLDKIFVSESL